LRRKTDVTEGHIAPYLISAHKAKMTNKKELEIPF